MPAGPDHRGVVLPLLDALVAMGRGGEADQLRQQFEARSWVLEQSDVARVLGLLSAPRQQELPLEPVTEVRAVDAQEDRLDDPAFIKLYRPFLEAIPAWRDLLSATNQLLAAKSWDELVAAAEEVFCGALGFDDDRVPLTHRLRGKSAVEVFEQLGSFKGFRVCLVRLTRSLSDTRWSNMSEHYRPCFRLVPRALLVSYEPGSGAIRLVFRQRHGRTDTRPRYRCIVGPWFLRDSQENLLTVCRRLDLCRPQFDEDAEGYGRRVQAALECDVGALADEWASGPLPITGELPGLSIHSASTQLMRGFLQAGEWQWGLRAHLGSLFPVAIKYGECWLDLKGIDLVSEPESPGDCWREARSRQQQMRLRLVTRTWEGLEDLESFEILTSLLVPDEDGWFWLEGRPYRHLPQAGADGRLLSRNSMPDWVNQVDAVDDEEEDDDSEEAEQYPLSGAEGAVVDSVIGRVVERRLWRLFRHLRRKSRESVDAGQMRAALLATVLPGESLPLLTLAAARTLMSPVELARPEREMSDVVGARTEPIGAPPAWACVDLSSDLQAHRWAAVSGARVHPTGALAVPSSDKGEVRLVVEVVSAFDVNPRLGAGTRGELSWWIHPRLASFAELPVGQLVTPARVASVGGTLEGAFSSPSVRRAHVAPWLRTAGPVLRTSVDVPKVINLEGGEPELLVEAGQHLTAGGPWLRIPGKHLAHHRDEASSHLEAVMGEHLGHAASGELVDRSPWDCDITVVQVGITTVRRAGAIVGWRAWIEARMDDQTPTVILPTGDACPIEPSWHPEELPYGLDGEIPNVVLPGEPGEELFFDGADGQVVQVTSLQSATLLPPEVPIRERAVLGAVDRLPRPGVRSAGEPWSWTRLRWLAEGVEEKWAEHVQGGRLHHQLLAWCAGVGAQPSSQLPEATTEVPIGSRPHRVGQRLSTIRWCATCTCKKLSGSALLGARCSSCGQQVAAREVVESLRECVLPMAVVHPWAKEPVAALLGLLPGEIETLLIRHGPAPVLEACRRALAEDPRANGSTRLGLPSSHPRALAGQDRRRLGQMLELLSATPEPAELFERLVMRRVGIPSLDLVKVGNSLDELTPTGSRLMAAYARLHGACWAVRRSMSLDSEPLLATAQVQLQACVDAILGGVDAHGSDSLAGLLRYTAPWCGDAARSVRVHHLAQPLSPDSSTWWEQRGARTQVVEQYAMELISLVWTLPGLPAGERKQAVRALARDLIDERRDHRGLLGLLHEARGRPLQLPSDWEQARATLHERLRPALGEQSLEVLLPALGGWWMGELSAEYPTGAVWLPDGQQGPAGFRRRLPPLSHMVWRTWPGIRAARPELALSRILDFEALALPVDEVPTVPVVAAEPALEVRAEVTAEPADEMPVVDHGDVPGDSPVASPLESPANSGTPGQSGADICVIRKTVREWLEQT